MGTREGVAGLPGLARKPDLPVDRGVEAVAEAGRQFEDAIVIFERLTG